jgi:hypothetical protein
MALPLTPNIAKAIDRLFSGDSREEVVRLLTERCADSLPNCRQLDEYSMEDLRFEVLKVSQGDLEKLRAAVQLANDDWRDLSAASGPIKAFKQELLGRDLERNPKSEAVERAQFGNVLFRGTAFVASLILTLFGFDSFAVAGTVLVILLAYIPFCLRYVMASEGSDNRIAILSLAGLTFVGVPGLLGFAAGWLMRSVATTIGLAG